MAKLKRKRIPITKGARSASKYAKQELDAGPQPEGRYERLRSLYETGDPIHGGVNLGGASGIGPTQDRQMWAGVMSLLQPEAYEDFIRFEAETGQEIPTDVWAAASRGIETPVTMDAQGGMVWGSPALGENEAARGAAASTWNIGVRGALGQFPATKPLAAVAELSGIPQLIGGLIDPRQADFMSYLGPTGRAGLGPAVSKVGGRVATSRAGQAVGKGVKGLAKKIPGVKQFSEGVKEGASKKLRNTPRGASSPPKKLDYANNPSRVRPFPKGEKIGPRQTLTSEMQNVPQPTGIRTPLPIGQFGEKLVGPYIPPDWYASRAISPRLQSELDFLSGLARRPLEASRTEILRGDPLVQALFDRQRRNVLETALSRAPGPYRY